MSAVTKSPPPAEDSVEPKAPQASALANSPAGSASASSAGLDVDAGHLLALTPTDARLVDGAARWMGMFGRFQVLAGGLAIALVVLGAFSHWLSGVLEDASASATTPPVVTLGDVSSSTVLAVAIVILVVGAIVARAGTLLIDAAEDLERALHVKGTTDAALFDLGLRRLGAYYALETLLVAAVAAGLAYAGGLV